MMTVLSATVLILAAGSAGAAADFNSAVERVLLQQKEIKELDSARQKEMIACVKQVLTKVPEPKQQYVAEGANYDEMENRFGEVVLADRAKFKQQITKACGDIVVSQ
jgi:uncharacterized protein (DUF1800 family)